MKSVPLFLPIKNPQINQFLSQLKVTKGNSNRSSDQIAFGLVLSINTCNHDIFSLRELWREKIGCWLFLMLVLKLSASFEHFCNDSCSVNSHRHLSHQHRSWEPHGGVCSTPDQPRLCMKGLCPRKAQSLSLSPTPGEG